MTDTPNQPKRVAVLGSTGSIGQQTLEVIQAFPDRFQVVALACRASGDVVAAQARRHGPKLVAVAEEDAAREVETALAGTGIEVAGGPAALIRCATETEADVVVAALAGAAGLLPVWEAVRVGRTVALANKEPLVMAGHLITGAAAKSGATLLPVDSEHSAIFQCLQGQRKEAVARVVLTASGGAFRDLPQEALAEVTPEQALAHPTWRMGPKVTVDSATLMNKGLELIEARWLFGLQPEQLHVVLHRESIVHSLVEFADGAVLAELARPDMRIPIQYALSFPERLPRAEPPPDLPELGALHFERLPAARWPCVKLARDALERGGAAPVALNAADEVAVDWFLRGRIGFTDICRVVGAALEAQQAAALSSIEEVLAVDREVRALLERYQAKWTSSAA